MTLLLVCLAALFVVLAWATVVGRAVLLSIDRSLASAHREPTDASLDPFTQFAVGLRAEMTTLTLAVGEGIARVERHEKRIQKTVSSARRLVADSGLEPHAALEAEAAEIRADHDDPRPPEEVPAVRESLDDDGPSGIPGLSKAELATMRGA